MLKLSGIHTFYGAVAALKGIDLEIIKGEMVSLIGGNGAGKSTTLMTISGILKPKKGSIIFNGMDIAGLAPYKIVELGICQVPEGRRIFPQLTVKENLQMGAYIGVRKNFERVYELFPVLKERYNQLGGTLSGGEQQMLAIARALITNPKILLLDEPSLGLAPIMTAKIFKTIKEINAEGMAVLLVEQNARAALKLTHRAYVIEGGIIKLHGKSEELLNNAEIKKAYLGA